MEGSVVPNNRTVTLAGILVKLIASQLAKEFAACNAKFRCYAQKNLFLQPNKMFMWADTNTHSYIRVKRTRRQETSLFEVQ